MLGSRSEREGISMGDDVGMLRRLYVERHAAKGESWAQEELKRVRANAQRTPVWVRATVSYIEKTTWVIIVVSKPATKTVVFQYRGDLGNQEELYSALMGFNKSPAVASISFLAVNAYETEEAAWEGEGAE
jgi:hypothetical protein